MTDTKTADIIPHNLPGGNFFLIGFMGSGKTHWGKKWAIAHQMSFIDLDEEIEKEANTTIAEIFKTRGEGHFRKLESNALRSAVHLQNTIIACGGGTPCFFDNMHWMNEHGTTIYIAATEAEVLERVLSEQEKRPLFNRLKGAELSLFISQKIKEREPIYTQAKLVVQSSRLTESSFAEIISLTS